MIMRVSALSQAEGRADGKPCTRQKLRTGRGSESAVAAHALSGSYSHYILGARVHNFSRFGNFLKSLRSYACHNYNSTERRIRQDHAGPKGAKPQLRRTPGWNTYRDETNTVPGTADGTVS